jgi:ribose-phosphate pyrophosphokinase
MENLKGLPVEKLIVSFLKPRRGQQAELQVTNSIDQTERVAACDGALETVDIAPIIAESIRRTHNG